MKCDDAEVVEDQQAQQHDIVELELEKCAVRGTKGKDCFFGAEGILKKASAAITT
jgi:hypothetical protein